jgi:hypothetical protein
MPLNSAESNLGAFAAVALVFIVTFVPVGTLAQPAGTYTLEAYYTDSECTPANVTVVTIDRIGLGQGRCEVQFGGRSFSYKDCNATHIVQYLCTSSDCSVGCEIFKGAQLKKLHCWLVSNFESTISMP